MLLERIEKSLKKIQENINKDNFIYDFLEAYEHPKSSIKRLKDGDYNLSKKTNEVIWKKKIYFYSVNKNEDIHEIIDNISKNEIVEKNKIRFIIVTDFNEFLSIDKKNNLTLDINFRELSKNASFYLPLVGLEKLDEIKESVADIKAAYKMGKLYDIIIKNNKDILKNSEERHALNIFFTRILFCFFADDSNIFEKNLFIKSVNFYTDTNGLDLEIYLEKLFDILNSKDRVNVPSYFKLFPFVNGGLFKDKYKIPKLTNEFRKILIDCGELEWNSINPDIFGSMMQAVIQQGERKELGMHYTTSANILKSIKPLFLDKLYEEFLSCNKDKKKLNKLLLKIYNINIFDPACGSGNFLVICYKELYKLEIKILEVLKELDQNEWLLIKSGIKLSQFHGIEIDDYAHEMAKLSLWIAEHQMNVIYSQILHEERPTLPLNDAGNIICENSTLIEWDSVCPRNKDKIIYLVGNPPYSGARKQTKEQKKDLSNVFRGFRSYKNLDYVACWFYLAAKYIKDINSSFSFVSTSSIAQGEQVSLIWPNIFNLNLEIFFAHKPFDWTNHARENAVVTCVIIGVQNKNDNKKYIFTDSNQKILVKFISPYLIDIDPTIIIQRENQQIINLQEMVMGNMPRDGGNFILTENEYKELINENKNAKKFIKKYVGSTELINGDKRWCLWINDDDVDEANNIKFIKNRIDKVKNFRLKSDAESTRKMSSTPHKFAQIQHQPDKALIIPAVTSSRRVYLPIDFVDEETVISNLCFAIYKPENYLFGILSSRMHMVWLQTVSGRFGDGYRYSSVLCYNSFIIPPFDNKKKKEIEDCVYNILQQRERYSDKNLFDLYNPDCMPLSLTNAHKDLDMTFEKIYKKDKFIDDNDRLIFLFKLFAKQKKIAMLF